MQEKSANQPSSYPRGKIRANQDINKIGILTFEVTSKEGVVASCELDKNDAISWLQATLALAKELEDLSEDQSDNSVTFPKPIDNIKNIKPKKTGYYKVEDSRLIEYEDIPGNGSINDFITHLGFELAQVNTLHTVFPEGILAIGVKVFTKQVVFVMTAEESPTLTMPRLEKEMQQVDWGKEYDSYNVENILKQGIEEHSLPLPFLNSVIPLQHEGGNLYLAPTLELYLSFEGGFLQSFAYSDWENKSSKYLKSFNEPLFNAMVAEAKLYHKGEREAFEEVNLQCDSFLNLPDGFRNENLSLHQKPNGTYNFYNLLLTHHFGEASVEEFKLVNKGRFYELAFNLLEVDRFTYIFSETGEFLLASRH